MNIQYPRALTLVIFALALPAGATAPAFPEGEMLLRHSEGTRTTDFRFVKSADTLRIEQLGESRLPPPINLINLENSDITIIAPINQSVRTLPATAFDPPKPADAIADWEIPPGLGANPTPPGTPAPRGVGVSPAATEGTPPGIPGSPRQAESPPRIGPDPSALPPGIQLPEMPAIPAMPNPGVGPSPAEIPGGIPGGIPGALPAGLPGGLPPMPGMPDLPGMSAPTGELVAHEETREMHGYPCQRHTLLLDRSLELTLWLAEHPDLPPFSLLVWDEPPRFGPRDPMQDWPHLVRRSGKFPMLVEMREAPRPAFPDIPSPQENDDAALPVEEERRILATWEIVSITPGKPDPALFEIPEGYFRVER